MDERTELTVEKAELCKLLMNSLYRDVCERANADEIGKTQAYPSQYDVEAIWNTIDDSWRDKSEF